MELHNGSPGLGAQVEVTGSKDFTLATRPTITAFGLDWGPGVSSWANGSRRHKGRWWRLRKRTPRLWGASSSCSNTSPKVGVRLFDPFSALEVWKPCGRGSLVRVQPRLPVLGL